MGVYIKELETNLFLFQFYHEVDVRRVMERCPWSFNRRALLVRRLKDGENPRSVELNTIDLWVQVYDLKIGFMYEKLITEVGNYIEKFVSSVLLIFLEFGENIFVYGSLLMSTNLLRGEWKSSRQQMIGTGSTSSTRMCQPFALFVEFWVTRRNSSVIYL